MKLEDINIEDLKSYGDELKSKMPEFNDIFKNLNDFKATIDKMNAIKKNKTVDNLGICLLNDNSVKITFESEEQADNFYKDFKYKKKKSWLKSLL